MSNKFIEDLYDCLGILAGCLLLAGLTCGVSTGTDDDAWNKQMQARIHQREALMVHIQDGSNAKTTQHY